jgi:hypothetical protein
MAKLDLKRQNELTDVSSISRDQTASTVPGMAHFAGTGPFGATCGDCSFWQTIPKSQRMHCAKYVRMTKDKVKKPVPSRTPACRHFEERLKVGAKR